MAWENASTVSAERIHRGLPRQDQGKTSPCWLGFLSASIQFCFVHASFPADSSAKPMLRRALALMRKRLDAGRGALLGPRSPVLPDGSLEKALGDICDDLASNSRTHLRIVILGQARPLVPAVHDQIYWIAREALLNALRHSAASCVEVEIEYLPRKLRVVVRDDGIGIDPEALRTARNSHSGLKRILEIAASVGAKVRIRSKQGEGTEAELSLPIRGKTALCASAKSNVMPMSTKSFRCSIL